MMSSTISITLLLLSTFGICKACNSTSATTVSGTMAPNGTICSGDLIFEDNFDSLRMKNWEHVRTLGGGGNWQFQWYTNNRSNTFAKDGILHIRPTFTADDFRPNFLYNGSLDINGGAPADECTNPKWNGCSKTGTSSTILNPIKSGYLRTVDSFSFKYGTVQVRAKAPTGDWLWAAIWLLPRYAKYGYNWPVSGEIDMMESRGNTNLTKSGQQIGVQQISSTLHFGPSSSDNRYAYTDFRKNNPNGWNDDFHVYQLNWTKDKIEFSVDGNVTGTVKPPSGGFYELGQLNGTYWYNPWISGTNMAPFDQEFYIILDLAVGGTSFFSDSAVNYPGGKPWSNSAGQQAATAFWNARNQWEPTWNRSSDSSHFLIDYVKVYAS